MIDVVVAIASLSLPTKLAKSPNFLDLASHSLFDVNYNRGAFQNGIRVGCNVLDIWREAGSCLVAHPFAILGWAWIGLALPEILENLPYAVTAESIIRHQVTLCFFSPPTNAKLLFLHGAGYLLKTLAAGMIAYTVLKDENAAGRWRSWKAIKQCFGMLLASGIIYSLSLAVVHAAMMNLYVGLGLDPASLYAGVMPNQVWMVLWRDLRIHLINAIIPHPEMLFCGAIGSLVWVQDIWMSGVAAWISPSQSSGSLLFTGFVVVLAIETLLRFRVVAVVAQHTPQNTSGQRSARQNGFSLGVAYSIRYFVLVSKHIWILQWMRAATMLVLVSIPMVLGNRIVIPRVAPMIPLLSDRDWVLITEICAILINSAWSAFAIIYDACLYRCLVCGPVRFDSSRTR